uniref:Protein FAM217B-like n=1 Tax=Paramormyrops kingsleyae TaxID=1676925 RepID=A0A3B3THG4_9TELE|nr:protein FAM217B-like [Paramormyrops kingsleyae]XP_023660868.1 protein FAM217B-like [Paramormyrops kingsleyae]
MGPILLERAAAPVLKVSNKEKRSDRSSENVGSLISSNKGSVSQNHRPQKKAAVQSKNTFRRKDSTLGNEKGTQFRGKSKPETPCNYNNDALIRNVRELGPKSPTSQAESNGESLVQPVSRCSGEDNRDFAGRVRSRPTLTLPLALPPEPGKGPGQQSQPFSLESTRLFEQKEDDTDSASDLSDSERLPVLPSPCTPPQLNLRAEVFDPSDLRQCIPESRGSGHGSHGYPDFLPPPFCTWSLRQLAMFLNTDGRGAPRPRPVGKLERYLERLLQLEWLQVQTVEAESRQAVSGLPVRPRRQSVAPRYSSAPIARLSSPKPFRQCQCAFPLPPAFCPASHPPLQHSHAGCSTCHLHFPLCNSICSSYAYHRHSRLSPVLERRAKPGVPPKRSSSESRVPAGQVWRLGSSPTGSGHLQRVQAAGNIRSPSQPQVGPRNGSPAAGTSKPKNSVVAKKGAAGKNAQQVNLLRESDTVRPKAGPGDGDGQLGAVAGARPHSSVSRGTPPARPNGKVKHANPITN